MKVSDFGAGPAAIVFALSLIILCHRLLIDFLCCHKYLFVLCYHYYQVQMEQGSMAVSSVSNKQY